MKKNLPYFLLTILFILSGLNIAVSQGRLSMPEISQEAEVRQRIGLTDIRIEYHSPLVKGRAIWGDLVPFGEVWRAGANENTIISFSTDVKIEGKDLPAGKYGMHMIPRKDTWTIIFSRDYHGWGSFSYKPEEDALRVEIKPEAAEQQEWLSYVFTDVKASSAKVVLRWEKIAAGFLVEVDVHRVVIENMKNELRGLAQFTWEGPYQAANYILQNGLDNDQAYKWIDQSIAMQENFNNLNVKSQLLTKSGKEKEGAELKARALSIANEQQLNSYGYQLLGRNQVKEAIEIFQINVKKHPDSWNVYDSLAEAYEINGNHKDAIINYKTALSKAPEAQKKRIQETISKIEKKK
jgi:hypothetical protein